LRATTTRQAHLQVKPQLKVSQQKKSEQLVSWGTKGEKTTPEKNRDGGERRSRPREKTGGRGMVQTKKLKMSVSLLG